MRTVIRLTIMSTTRKMPPARTASASRAGSIYSRACAWYIGKKKRVATAATAQDTTTDFAYHNIQAFEPLIQDYDVELRAFSDEIIARLGVRGGVGYAYEYGGPAVERMSMDERMTMCNMSIEGGARIGYVNPDETTFEYMAGRPFAPAGDAFDRAREWWRSLASDPDAAYDDDVELDGNAIEPRVTWGINPGQSVGVSERIPAPGEAGGDADAVGEAQEGEHRSP